MQKRRDMSAGFSKRKRTIDKKSDAIEKKEASLACREEELGKAARRNFQSLTSRDYRNWNEFPV